MQVLAESISVWTEGRDPVRLFWRGERFAVTDTPTPLRASVDAGLTHPIERQWGWRFQATNEGGDSYVFDVEIGVAQDWRLVAVYD